MTTQAVAKSNTQIVPQTRRLNINLPERAFNDLQELAKKSGRTMTEIMRIALGLVKVAIEETEANNRLAIIDPDGKPLKEILLVK